MSDDRYSLVRIGNSPNWYIQWFDGGHSRRVSTRSSQREIAEGRRRQLIFELEASPTADAPVDTLLDFYLNGRGPELADRPRQDLAASHLRAFFGATAASAAGPFTQDRYVSARRLAGVSDETIRRELSVLSAALHYAQKRERIERAPPMITLQKSPPKERWLSREEAALILRHLRTGYLPAERIGAYNAGRAEIQAARNTRRKKPSAYVPEQLPHLVLFTRLALFTGARSGVILALTWDRVDFKRALIAFPVPGKVLTNKRAAIVPIAPALVSSLRALKKRRRAEDTDHVITWNGEPVGRILRAFSRHMDWLGMPDVTPHTLRHTFATWAAQKGVSLFLVGRALGQSSQSVTDRYAKHQPDALRAVTEAVRRR